MIEMKLKKKPTLLTTDFSFLSFETCDAGGQLVCTARVRVLCLEPETLQRAFRVWLLGTETHICNKVDLRSSRLIFC